MLVLGLRLVGEVAQADERVLEAVVLLLELDERERAAVPVAALAELLVAGALHPRVLLAQDDDLDLELGDALLGALECAVRELEPLLGDFLVQQADLDLVRQVEQLGFELVSLGRELLVLEAGGSVASSGGSARRRTCLRSSRSSPESSTILAVWRDGGQLQRMGSASDPTYLCSSP